MSNLSIAKRVIRTLPLASLPLAFMHGAAIAADFEDFPDVPEVVSFDETFRQAGFYAGVRGSISSASDTDFSIAGPVLIENDYDLGYGASGFLGFEFTDLYFGIGGRVEVEVGYDTVEIDTHTVGGTRVASADSFGDTNALTGAANIYADYSIGAFRPFIGAGLGYARVRFEDHGVTGALSVMDDADNGFLWQAAAGAAYDFGSGFTLEGMVRYRSIMDIELTATSGVESSTDIDVLQFLAGVRIAF